MRMNIIGAGNVGQTLGKLFVKYHLLEIQGIYNRTKSRALDAIDFIGQGEFYSDIIKLPHADITLITTSDSYLAKAAYLVGLNENLQPGDIVVHCSGVQSSDGIDFLRSKGCLVVSIHPMRSFTNPQISVLDYNGTYCAIEGDPSAVLVLRKLFEGIGSCVYKINKMHKPLYHAAAVFVSNYMLTLAQQGLDCLDEAGVEKDLALSLVINLMQGTLNNFVKLKSSRDALTGPIKRGDDITVEKHIAAFSRESQRELYAILAKATKDMLNDF